MRRGAPAAGRRGSRRRITLARALSKYGIASRTAAARMILGGEVSVNGRAVRDPAVWVDPAYDVVTLRGARIRRAEIVYVAMHKPAGVVTTRSDEKGRPTVYGLLPEGLPWVFPVGRLDRDTSGLLLFTNDTGFGEHVTGPAGRVRKTYRVDAERPLSPEEASLLRLGLVLPDGDRCRPAEVTIDADDPRRCIIVITEGKNRQVRRMFESLGNRVLLIHRLAVGSVNLGDLGAGETRNLTGEEIASLSGKR